MKQISSRAIVLLLLVAVFIGGAVNMFASPTDSVTGTAWSSNVGWFKLNNCDTPSSCSGIEYGLNIPPQSGNETAYLSGYIWSSNIGWVSFNGDAVNTSDIAGSPGCATQMRIEGSCRAFADWTRPLPDGGVPIRGFARACSVFASGCSGVLAAEKYRGGWDGYIALGASAGTTADWGVKINPDMSISGYGWGDMVVGWVQFDGKINLPEDLCKNLPGVQEQIPVGMNIDTNGDCVTPNPDVCPNIAGVQLTTPVGMQIISTGDCVSLDDACSNIPGIQSVVPNGMQADGSRTCIPIEGDLCLNIDGVQEVVPTDRVRNAAGNCLLKKQVIYEEI